MQTSISKSSRPWLVLVPAMILPVIAALFYFVWYADQPIAQMIYAFTKGFTLIWPLLVAVVICPGLVRPLRSEFIFNRNTVVVGIVSGVVIVAVAFLALQTSLAGVVDAAAPAVRLKAEQLGFIQYYWAFAVFLSVFHSAIEEYYWRWFVYGGLDQLVSRNAAHALAACAFAAHHVVVTTQFFGFGYGLVFGAMVGVGGLIWSQIYRRTGSLAGAWISHMIVDFGIMIIGYQLLTGP